MATRLQKTQGTATSTKKFTFSAWIKKSSNVTGNDQVIYDSNNDSNNRITVYFRGSTDNTFNIYGALSGSQIINLETTRLFRDVSAWYHIVVAFDTTQGTAADRIKIYVNGTQETAFNSSTYPSQDAVLPTGSSSYVHSLGYYTHGGSSAFQGYMAHPTFCDGTALTPTSFGFTDATSGIWKFKPPSGFTFGNNGFHLKFENSGNIGLDSSGQGNNFTTSTGTALQSLDTPSNILATLNYNYVDGGSAITYTNGGTTADVGSGNNWCTSPSTLGVSAGKWYFEAKLTLNSNTEAYIGVANQHNLQIKTNEPNYLGEDTDGIGYYSGSGDYYYNVSSYSYGNSWTTGDIVGCALDIDNSKLYFSKNGTWQNSGVPTSGSTGTGAIALNHTAGDVWHLCVSPNQSKLDCNFGNGFFGTTAITSAGSNGNGYLFEYDVPSGYYALSTKNINTYG